MKILFINSNYYDYLQDIVYSGLVKILGSKNILELPWNPKYHLPFKKYPKNIGYVATSFWPSLISSNKDYDAVIIGACKADAVDRYLEIATSIPPKCPVIFLDGGDRPEVGGDLERLGATELWDQIELVRPFDHIFKREYKINFKYAQNVQPLPFGFNLDRLPISSREPKYDVAFWAAESHPSRTKALKLLKGKFDCALNGTEQGKNMYSFKRRGKEYLRELSRVKINLSLQGGGFDTLRYWEIPAVKSMLLSEQADIVIPNNFTDEQSAIFCNPDLTDLIDKASYYLKYGDKRDKIAQAGYGHLISYHTDKNRAEAILEAIT